MNYELVSIIPLLTETETKETITKIEDLLKSAGAEVGENKLINRGHLPYPIKNLTQGQHCVLKFNAEPAKVGELVKSLKLFNGLIRFSVNKKIKMQAVEVKEKPALVRGWTKREEAPVIIEEVKKDAPAAEKPTLEDLDKKLSEILGGGI